MTEGYVYFIRNNEGYIKIGIATDVQKRLAQLQTANAHKLELVGAIPHIRYKDIEVRLHEQFADKRLLGEWFEISGDDVVQVLMEYRDGIEYGLREHCIAQTELFTFKRERFDYSETVTVYSYSGCLDFFSAVVVRFGRGSVNTELRENVNLAGLLDEGSHQEIVTSSNFEVYNIREGSYISTANEKTVYKYIARWLALHSRLNARGDNE